MKKAAGAVQKGIALSPVRQRGGLFEGGRHPTASKVRGHDGGGGDEYVLGNNPPGFCRLRHGDLVTRQGRMARPLDGRMEDDKILIGARMSFLSKAIPDSVAPGSRRKAGQTAMKLWNSGFLLKGGIQNLSPLRGDLHQRVSLTNSKKRRRING